MLMGGLAQAHGAQGELGGDEGFGWGSHLGAQAGPAMSLEP